MAGQRGRTVDPGAGRRRRTGLPAAAVAGRLGALGLLSLLGLLGQGACTPEAERIADGKDPLASLGVAATSQVYDLAFWVREERAKSRLWRSAAEYCRRRPEEAFPNCRNVRMAAWWAAPPEFPRLADPGPAPGGAALGGKGGGR
jgi:hypothetical protein